MRNAGLDETQAGIKITGENINNLRYSNDNTMAESKEEVKNLLIKAKEEKKTFRKLRSLHPVLSLHGK